jgi:helix-turn-helix protein
MSADSPENPNTDLGAGAIDNGQNDCGQEQQWGKLLRGTTKKLQEADAPLREVLVYLALLEHARYKSRLAWPSRKTLFKMTGIKPNHVSGRIKWLKEHGFIELVGTVNRVKKYRVVSVNTEGSGYLEGSHLGDQRVPPEGLKGPTHGTQNIEEQNKNREESKPSPPKKKRTQKQSTVMGFPKWKQIPSGSQKQILNRFISLSESLPWKPKPPPWITERLNRIAVDFQTMGNLEIFASEEFWESIKGKTVERPPKEPQHWHFRILDFLEAAYAKQVQSAEQLANEQSQQDATNLEYLKVRQEMEQEALEAEALSSKREVRNVAS